MVRPYSPHCPNCAAPLSFDITAAAVDCVYCGATLILNPGRVTHERARQGAPPGAGAEDARGVSRGTADGVDAMPAVPQPNPTLSVHDAERFSLRILEQRADGVMGGGIFRSVELDGGRFAVATLRCVDADEKSLLSERDWTSAWDVLVESLGDDGDPGLAMNLVLEELAQDPMFVKLQAAVAVLDPERGTALVYCAGMRDVYWLSTEEARPIFAGPSHSALEKADLAKRGDQFDNGKELRLAASDLIVLSSFAYMDDPVIGRGGARVLVQTLRDNLAESPERVVTLAKNAFWQARAERQKGGEPLGGDIVVAAVGARLPEPAGAAPSVDSIETFVLPHFHITVQASERDHVDLWRLSGGRHAFMWYSSPPSEGAGEAGPAGIQPEAMQRLHEGVHAVLDNEGHGYFDNAREGARAGIRTMGGLPDGASLLVVHLASVPSSRGGMHCRVKYFARGCQGGLALGARGLRPGHEHQRFDEGGELSLDEHGRILFPGRLPIQSAAHDAEELALGWYGGKASHLYESLRLHWRTRKGEKALAKIAAAAYADTGPGETPGLVLITAT